MIHLCVDIIHICIRIHIHYIKKKEILQYNLMFCLLGPKDSIVYYNDGEPNDNLQGKCYVAICNYVY